MNHNTQLLLLPLSDNLNHYFYAKFKIAPVGNILAKLTTRLNHVTRLQKIYNKTKKKTDTHTLHLPSLPKHRSLESDTPADGTADQMSLVFSGLAKSDSLK